MEKIRILLADDRLLAREGLCRLLEREEDLDCVGIAEDGEQAVKLVRELKPDVAIIDVAMPKIDGIETVREIKLIHPKTAVLMVSAYKYDHYVLSCIAAGADGYLLKENLHGKRLVNAIHMIYSGEKVFDSEATSELLCRLANGTLKKKPRSCELGKRELEILKLSADGVKSKEIAYKLGITERTVGTHFVHIFRKLGVESRLEAVLYAFKRGWISIDEISYE
jgi:DNA-binding NarL/FixJ family response regulator